MDILNFLQQVVSVQQAEVLSAMLVANFALGILAALKTKTFQLAKLGDIWKRIGYMLGGYIAVSGLTVGIAQATNLSSDWGIFLSGGIRDLTWVAFTGYMLAQISSNVCDIFGIQLPESVQKVIEWPSPVQAKPKTPTESKS